MSHLENEQGPSRRLWFLAAMLALVLHLGGAALAVGYLKADEDDGGLAANATEFAVELESPRVPDENLPAGPDVDAAQASTAQIEKKAEAKETDLAADRPTTSADADRVVTENKSKEPKDDPRLAALQTEASPEQNAQVATARQQLDEKARESEQTKAPNSGIGKDRLALKAKWDKIISAYFQRHLRYPEKRDKSAMVKVALVLNRRGNVVSVNVMESSGDQAFDDAAVSMVRRSDPLPPPPAELTDDQFSFNLPVKFTKPAK